MNRPRKADRHLPPCVYFKHGAYWHVKRGKWARLGTDLVEAMTAYARLVETPKGGMSELIEKVYGHHTPKLADETKKSYRGAADRLKVWLVAFAPEQVQGKHVAAIKLKMCKHPALANHTLSFLRTVFNYAVEWQLVGSNPCIGVKPYPLKKRDRYLTDAEFAAIRAKAGPRLQVIMDLCYLTGQRISDVLGIHHRDLGAEGIYFKAQKTENSTQVKFVVAWTDDLRAVVERAKALQAGVLTMSLLAGRTRKPPTYRTVVGQWWAACEAAGVEDANIHDMRAKSLTDAEAQGLDPTALAGHADAKMTERYIRLRQTPLVKGPTLKRTG